MHACELQFGEDHPLYPKHVLHVYAQKKDARHQHSKMQDDHISIAKCKILKYSCDLWNSTYVLFQRSQLYFKIKPTV